MAGHVPQMAPVPQIGIFTDYCVRGPHPEVLVLREKVLSLTGDSFEIKLMNGQPIFRVQGKVMSISGRKSFFDMANNHLFDIVKEHFHLHTTYACEDPQGNKFFEVKSGFKLLGSSATANFTDKQGKAHSLKMKGNWFDTAADITDETTGHVVARIDRKLLSGRDIIFNQQTYAVEVAPGVDMALMAAMCICMDEKNNEN